MYIGVRSQLTIEANGTRLEDRQIGGRRTRLALVFLILERNRAIPSEELAEVLWSGNPASSRPSSLREVLTLVRRVLAAVGCRDVVSTKNGYIHVTLPEHLVVDVEQALAAAARLEAGGWDPGEACRLAETVLGATASPLLPGEDGSWLTTVRARLWLARMTAFEALAEAHIGAGRAELALSPARALIDEDPLRESGHELLVRSLAALGRNVEALATYRRYRELLVNEVGLDPPPHMERLQGEILRDRPAGGLPVTAAVRARTDPLAVAEGVTPGCSSPPRAADTRIPFVDRAALVDELADAVRRQPAADFGVILITGEMGVGKTRLLSELIGHPALSEHATRYGCCLTGGRVGGALLEALGGWDAPALTRDEDEWTALGRLQELAEHRAAVVVLDDMHAADPTTIMFVARLARARLRGPVTLVLAARDDEQSAALDVVRAELHRVARPREIVLGPLNHHAIAELAGAFLGRRLSVDRIRRLAADSGGIPLYLVGLLEAMRDAASGRASVQAASGLHAMVRLRLVGLSGGAAGLLSAAALAGDEFPASAITRAPEEADAAGRTHFLEELLERGLLEVADSGAELRLRFRHGIVAAVVRDGLNRSRRSHRSEHVFDLEGTTAGLPAIPA